MPKVSNSIVKLVLLFSFLLFVSCELQEIVTDAGPEMVNQKELFLDSAAVEDVNVHAKSASNAFVTQLHCGDYMDVRKSIFLKFENLVSIDSTKIDIKEIQLVMHKADNWGVDVPFPVFNLYFLPCEADADTSFAWTSYSDIDSLWDHVSSESMTKTEFELENESDDSMVFLIDITDITENSSKIKAWENGINTGLFIDFNGSEKFMQAWYSRDYLEGAYAPVLELICDIMDSTTNTTTYDTTLFLEASADLTHSINDKIGEENNLYISSGNIYQSSFVMPALTDSLVNNNILIVQAELTCNISNVFCRESDSLMVFLLIKEENSIDSTVYDVIGDLVVSDTLTVDDTALSFHADNLVQYLIGGGRTTETRLYFEFASKYEEYSHITLDESSFSVNLIYAELE